MTDVRFANECSTIQSYVHNLQGTMDLIVPPERIIVDETHRMIPFKLYTKDFLKMLHLNENNLF
jgi:hypothetical protein